MSSCDYDNAIQTVDCDAIQNDLRPRVDTVRRLLSRIAG